MLLLFPLMLGAPAGPQRGHSTLNPQPLTAVHDIHVTLTRMAVDSAAVVARIRCFRDDLQVGLAKFYKQPKVELAAGAKADSLFGGYLAERMWVEADGVRLAGTVRGSGTEVDNQGQPVIWFVVEYPTAARPKTLGLRNDLLFDAFPSQQNIINVLNVQDEKRYSLYFVPGSDKIQQVSLR